MPFIILTFIYFIVGFLTTLNGQFQAPLKVAFLSESEKLGNTLTTMISFFFFLGYLLNSNIGGKWINKHGYKTTLLRALGIMVSGLLMYEASSWFITKYSSITICLCTDRIPVAYFIFLTGSFLMGTSAALLQVVINPYIAAYELPGTSSVQRMNINCAINSLGTTIAPFFVTGIIFAGVAMDDVTPESLLFPILAIAVCMIITTAATSQLTLPDLANTRSNEKDLERSVWSFRHLKLGVIAIFFYVGTEVAVGVNINMHAVEMGKNPALLATIYWGGMMAGRIAFSMFPKISARTMLTCTTILATAMLVIAIACNNLWILSCVGLCHSVMWSCIFTLAIQGLGKYTGKASGTFMMGVFGGAVFPVLQGILADIIESWRWTWFLAVICELVMLYYARFGSRINEKDIVS